MSRILNSKIISFLLVIVLGWLGLSLIEIEIQKKFIHNEAKEIEKKMETAKKENSNLEKIITYLQNPSFLEKEVRLKLNYKAPDEKVAFIYRDTAASGASESFEKKLASMPNYKKWWYWLFGAKIKN